MGSSKPRLHHSRSCSLLPSCFLESIQIRWRLPWIRHGRGVLPKNFSATAKGPKNSWLQFSFLVRFNFTSTRTLEHKDSWATLFILRLSRSISASYQRNWVLTLSTQLCCDWNNVVKTSSRLIHFWSFVMRQVEKHSEPSQTSKMELHLRYLTGFSTDLAEPWKAARFFGIFGNSFRNHWQKNSK